MKKPKNFGKFWSNKEYSYPDGTADFVTWYQWMYESRGDLNGEIIEWVAGKGGQIQSIADLGCGIGIGFTEAFADKEFIGVDISKRNIEWCKQVYTNLNHCFLDIDFIEEDLPQKVDLVLCNGTLENVWDINKALKSMVNNSKKWIYAASTGWHPDLEKHRYDWREEWGCYSSCISPSEARAELEALGSKNNQKRS